MEKLRTPEYFNTVALIAKKVHKFDREIHPVDYTCMHSGCCKTHPEEFFNNCIDNAAKLGKYEVVVSNKELDDNLISELFKTEKPLILMVIFGGSMKLLMRLIAISP